MVTAETEAKPNAEVASAEDLTDAAKLDTVASTPKADVNQIRELSVEPETQPWLPENRPAWVGAPVDTSTSNHRIYVGSFPVSNEAELDEALDQPMVAAVYAYLSEHVFEGENANRLKLTSEFIRQNLVDPSAEFVSERATREGLVYQKWVALVVSPEQRAHFQKEMNSLIQRDRMTGLGLGVLGFWG